jgi:hypothetical protein
MGMAAIKPALVPVDQAGAIVLPFLAPISVQPPFSVALSSFFSPRPRQGRPSAPKAHITHVLTKLGLTNRTQIALLVHDAGSA